MVHDSARAASVIGTAAVAGAVGGLATHYLSANRPVLPAFVVAMLLLGGVKGPAKIVALIVFGVVAASSSPYSDRASLVNRLQGSFHAGTLSDFCSRGRRKSNEADEIYEFFASWRLAMRTRVALSLMPAVLLAGCGGYFQLQPVLADQRRDYILGRDDPVLQLNAIPRRDSVRAVFSADKKSCED